MTGVNASDIHTAILTEKELPWTRQQLPEAVSEEFMRMVDASGKEARIKKLIQQMYASTQVETI